MPFDPSLRGNELAAAVATRILLLDGAMGTMLQRKRPSAADYGGPALEGCTEQLCRTHPEWVIEIHRAYLDAGADILETNSFQASPLVLAEFGLGASAHELNVIAASLARQAADEYAADGRPRFVAGAMGPTTRSLTLGGNVTFDEMRRGYRLQAKALLEGGADLILFETAFDTRNVKAGLLAIQGLERELGFRIPVMVSGTIERSGTMLCGQGADAFYVSVAHADLLSIGLNCATGPDLMADAVRTLSSMATTCVSCHPNAGLPDERGEYGETPELFAAQLATFVDHGWLNLVGGCCGTTPDHIRALAKMIEGRKPRVVPTPPRRSYYSGIELVEADDSNRPLIVGERTNATGSRLFARLIAEEKWDDASEIARSQVRHGAQIVDVCLQASDRDERSDVDPFYARLMPKIRVPVMIETTDAMAVERALTWCQGKAIVNSINLEDGEEPFARVARLARAYGAAIVVGTIDEDHEQAQAITRERKLAIAERSVRLLTGTYGIAPEDIIIDPLVFPVGTGEANYAGGAVETIEAIRLIKVRIPFVKTLLGISAVSFGLPDRARPVVNSVFLYHATRAGLDLAMVNAEKLERFASVPPFERELAEKLLFGAPNGDALEAIAAHFRQPAPKDRAPVPRTLDQRLSAYVVEGSRAGLIADLERKRETGASPLDIINGPLMAGMAEVGRLFNDNELIVAEVLQSAEVMNAAVNYLRPYMEKDESAVRGTILLATVKGDVHDIGKNLVEIVLSNNGYRVVNLGIRVAPEDLIQAVRQHRPDAIGLSGLLVKSAHQMVATATDLREHGVAVPLLVGGAALSETFVRGRIGPAYGAPTFYARDAMTGLRILNELSEPSARDAFLRAHIFASTAAAPILGRVGIGYSAARSSRVRTSIPIPAVDRLDRRMVELDDQKDVWSYINPFMLYGRHLGFRGDFTRRLAEGDPKAIELGDLVDRAKRDAGFMKVCAVWRFFEAEREGNSIRLFEPGASVPAHVFRFDRQTSADGLCLSDYVLDPVDGRRDHVALFVVTAGHHVRAQAEAAKARGALVLSHVLQALAVETAEAGAEWLHRRIREEWGFPDPPGTSMADRFKSRYRGKRYSFGYPACPNLEDQQGLFALLTPEDIGVQLTDGFMMEPEASVSALVFHHPDCSYFALGEPQTASR